MEVKEKRIGKLEYKSIESSKFKKREKKGLKLTNVRHLLVNVKYLMYRQAETQPLHAQALP